MECSVFDTYVEKKNGGLMHFDVIVPTDTNEEQVYNFGHQYLAEKGEGGQELSTSQCKFCHIEKAQPHVQKAIEANGYFILEMEGC